MNKFIKVFTMFFLITFSSILYADAPGPVNLSLKGIIDWIRFFQFVEYGTDLPSTPSTRGVWFILWVNNEPALYWSNGSEWIPFVTAGVQGGSVDTDALADGAVTTPKLADSSVSTNKIVNYAVTTNKIADNAVIGTKFANNSIATAKLAPYAVTNEKLGYLSVGTLNLQNGAVTSDKMESTISDKNIVLNNGTVLNPSLSFHSDIFSGLSYDSASSTIDVSIGASDKIKIGSSFVNFKGLSDGISVSSASERIVLQSDGLHHDDISLTFNNDIIASGSIIPSEDSVFDLGSSAIRWNTVYGDNGVFTNLEFDVLNVQTANIDNASVAYNITATNILASETVYTDSLKSFTSGGDIVVENTILPKTAGTTNLGNVNKQFNAVNALNAVFTNVCLGTSGSYAILTSDIINSVNVFMFENSILPSTDKQLNIGDLSHAWKNLYTENVIADNIFVATFSYPLTDNEVELGTSTYRFKSGDIINLNATDIVSDNISITDSIKPTVTNTVELGTSTLRFKSVDAATLYGDNMISTNASFTNMESDTATITKILLQNELVSSGTVNVSKILINGEPLTSDVNMKFPSSLAVIDIEASKYSLKDNVNLQNDYSQTWQYTSYAEDGDGLYMTYKNNVSISSSCYVTTLDTFDFSSSVITLRLKASNLSLGTSNANVTPLLSIASGISSFISIVRDTDGKLNIKNTENTKVINTDYTAYDWNETHDIFLITEISTNNMYLYVDGDLIEEFTLEGTSSMANSYRHVVIGGRNPDRIDGETLPDHNIRFRKIQVYNRSLKVNEMKSLPTIEAVVKLNRKNTTNPPCYTLGEPSTLIGGDFDSGEGFFGEVSGDKFIYGWEVLAQLWGMDMNVIDTKAKFIASFTSVFGSNISYKFTGQSYDALGVSDNLEVEWLKFYDHEKIIFIPKRPLLNNITWNEINNVLANCTVGKEIKIDLRRMNSLIDSTYSNGNLISVKCRLMTGGNIQPWIYGNVNESGIKDNALGMGSEWNRLIYRICDQIPSDTYAGDTQGWSGGKQIGDNWFNFTGSELGFNGYNDLGRITFTQEYCNYQNTPYMLARASEYAVANVFYQTPSDRFDYIGFRPVLVLEVMKR